MQNCNLATLDEEETTQWNSFPCKVEEVFKGMKSGTVGGYYEFAVNVPNEHGGAYNYLGTSQSKAQKNIPLWCFQQALRSNEQYTSSCQRIIG